MKFSIRNKITLTYTALFLVIFAILGSYLSIFFANQYTRDLEANLVNHAKLFSGFIDNMDRGFLEGYAQDISLSLGLRVTIIDIEGKPLVETAKPVDLLDNHIDRPEIQSALRGNIVTSKRFSDTVNADMVYAAAPIYNRHGELLGFFRLAKSLEEINDALAQIRFVIFTATIVGILFTWFFGAMISGAITKSLGKLTKKARDFGEGYFYPGSEIQSRDEIGELELVFNEMGKNISFMMDATSRENARIENILKNLPVGVLIINKKGLVEASNSAAKDILNTDIGGVNKPLIHLTRDYHVNEFVKKILAGEEKKQLEIILSDANGDSHFIRLIGAIVQSQKGETEEMVVVLQDITDIRRLEQMRKDLVANVSHELRTPITAIQGFAETLLDEDVDEETTKHFLSIIKEESNRLTRLITDLLNLSKLESGFKKSKEGTSSLLQNLESVTRLLDEKIRAKNHQLIIDVKDDHVLAMDQDYVEQVLVNYIDNAIKYNPNGTTITVSAEKQDNGFLRFVVIDNGPGIPAKDQNRLFERFFRVERSRQRGVGGTGLGLAIVKHIVEGFNGEVGVRSSSTGTAFWATLPLKK